MSDGKLIRGLQSRLQEFPEGLLVAALYAAACWAARQVSLDQFFLPAGIRVAALLVCRREMWPYLLLGEYAYFAHLRIPMIEMYGLIWVFLGSCYQLPMVAFIVRLHRRAILRGDYAYLLPLSVLAAISISFLNVALAYVLWPERPSEDFVVLSVRYSIGEFLGIVTVAPLALLCLKSARAQLLGNWLGAPTALMTLAFVSLIGTSFFYPDLRAGDVPIQVLMVLPVIGFTFIHGWRGAAVGIPALNLAVHLCTEATGLPGSFDPSTFKNQLTLAVVGATLILFGTASPRKRKSEGGLVPLASVDRDMHQFSQQSLEMTLRRHVLGIRHVYEDIDRAVCDLADWLQERGYFEMAKATRHLATITSREMRDRSSLIYPTSLEHVGLYLALQVGGIGHEWRTSARVATHQLSGDPCRLSLAVQLAAYRSITEAVSMMLEMERGPVRLRAKCGSQGGIRGIVIVISLLNEGASLSRAFRQKAFERLAASADTYGGKVECKRNRLRMHLSDPG